MCDTTASVWLVASGESNVARSDNPTKTVTSKYSFLWYLKGATRRDMDGSKDPQDRAWVRIHMDASKNLVGGTENTKTY